LVFLTHTFGDAVAQSLLHEATGFITFSVALGGVIALDALVGPWLARRRSKSKYDSKPGRPAISTVIQ